MLTHLCSYRSLLGRVPLRDYSLSLPLLLCYSGNVHSITVNGKKNNGAFTVAKKWKYVPMKTKPSLPSPHLFPISASIASSQSTLTASPSLSTLQRNHAVKQHAYKRLNHELSMACSFVFEETKRFCTFRMIKGERSTAMLQSTTDSSCRELFLAQYNVIPEYSHRISASV